MDILKLNRSMDLNEQREYYPEIQRILNQIGVIHSGIEETGGTKTDSKKKAKGRQSSPTSIKGEEMER